MSTTATLIRELIAAGVSPTEAAKAATAAMADTAPKDTAPKDVTKGWRTAVITAAQGFTPDKGRSAGTYQELMQPGTIRVVDGDESAGTVIGRDAKRPDDAAVRVGHYRRNKAGEYRVRSDAFSEGELREYLGYHAKVYGSDAATPTAKRPKARKADTGAAFDPSTASLAELKAHAEATGQRFDGRWTVNTARKNVHA